MFVSVLVQSNKTDLDNNSFGFAESKTVCFYNCSQLSIWDFK